MNIFCGFVVVNHEGKVLVIHHRKSDTWRIPGGKPNPGELLVEAAKRELKEETGVLALDSFFSHQHDQTHDGITWRGLIFVTKHWGGTPGLVEPAKIDGIGWADPSELVFLNPLAAMDLGDIVPFEELSEAGRIIRLFEKEVA